MVECRYAVLDRASRLNVGQPYKVTSHVEWLLAVACRKMNRLLFNLNLRVVLPGESQWHTQNCSKENYPICITTRAHSSALRLVPAIKVSGTLPLQAMCEHNAPNSKCVRRSQLSRTPACRLTGCRS